MVQVLDEPYSASAQFGAGLGKSLPNMTQQFLDVYARKKENEALEKRGIDLKGISDPNTRSAIIQESLKRGTAINQGMGTVPDEFKGLLGGKNQQGQDFSSPGQQPQSQGLQGQGDSILSPQQIKQEAARRVQQKAQNRVPTTYEDELANVRAQNDDIVKYQASQQNAAAVADSALLRINPNATDEHRAYIHRKAEQYAQQNLTPAQLEKRLAEDTKRFTNQLNSIKKSLPPKRLLERAKNAALGTGRSAERANESIRLKLKPLLDQGFYDTARNLLSEVGYAPEERESVISNLGEVAKKSVAQLTKPKHFFHTFSGDEPELNPTSPEYDKFKQSISDVLKQDNATNLILLRKAYEDKGVDWRSFKNELDDLMVNKQFTPNEEQEKALDILDQPPLNRLEKVLHNLKLIGR